MPFEGPDGQGPYDSMQECIDAMEDEPGVDDPEGLCAYWKELDENDAQAMTDPTDEVQHRQHYRADPADVSVRQIDQEEDGLFTIEMPIASTGEVRNEGDDPLGADELRGMARQINEQDVGVFLAHGDSNAITAARYGQTERLGNWRDAEVKTRDGADADLLFASAELMDPETLPNIGPIRDALGTIKEQAKRGIGISSSIGWRDAEDAPGGNDLMEASIVGIPADPRTVSQSGAEAVARAAVDAGADPDALVAAVRDAVTDTMTDDESPDESDEQSADTTDEESTERQEAPEWAERLLEQTDAILESLEDIADRVTDEDDDDDDEDEEDMAAEEDDDEDDEQSADGESESGDTDTDAEHDVDPDEIAAMREQLAAARDAGFDVDLPDDPDTETDRDETDTDDTPDEPAAKRLVRGA